jgi:hypothetical protein
MARHPGGRTCQLVAPLVLLLMPYALARYAVDRIRGRKRQTR